jgi:hypothetical protein
MRVQEGRRFRRAQVRTSKGEGESAASRAQVRASKGAGESEASKGAGESIEGRM